MQYKGDDLDLRVPELRSRQPRDPYAPDYDATPQANGRWPRSPNYGTGPQEPLWVDETVLACCNYAYDIAMANGAGEVGLEHLVNALTRVEQAARILEARGVREGQLRRESASLIASEIPVTAGSDRNPPRRSPDFEDVLRRAVEQAGRRGTAANVDDVLWVILHFGRDVAAVQLLRRHTPDWQRQDWQRQDGPRQDWQRPDWNRRDGSASEPGRIAQSMPPAHAAGYATYDVLPNRIALIEDSLRALHVELSSERKSIGDLIRDTQRDIVAQRGDGAALRNDLAQRLEGLERGLQAGPQSSRLTVQLSDRIQTLEKAVHGGLGEGARNWAALGQRLQGLETTLAAASAIAPAFVDHKPLLERIAGLEQGLDGKLTQTIRVTGGLADRLQGLERLVEAGAGEGGRHWAALSERLGMIETAMRARPQGSGSPEVAELVERVGGLERAVRAGFGDSLRVTTVVSDRLAVVEKAALAAPGAADDEGLLMLDDRMQSIERMLQDQAAAQIAAKAAPANFDFDIGEMAAPFTRRMGIFEEQAAERSRTLETLLREASARVAALEQRVSTGSSAQDEATRGRDREVAEMHEAIVRLSENQHTLASAIADWRQESHRDFGGVSAQLEKIAQTTGPMTTEAVASDFPSVARGAARAQGVAVDRPGSDRAGIERANLERTSLERTSLERPSPERVTIDRPATDRAAESGDRVVATGRPGRDQSQLEPARRRGFWWWLFGTSNIMQANRDAEIRWKQMHERMKDARERKRA